MSQRPHLKSKIKVLNRSSVFHTRDKACEDSELSTGLIKSAKRTGQLSLCNRGLGAVPENVWKINEIVMDEHKDIDLNRSDSDNWWSSVALKSLDLSSNAIKNISPNVKLLGELISLNLQDNAIEQLPGEIGDLNVLETLNLSHNKIVSLPKEFYKLAELKLLTISHNILEKIEPEFGDLVMLKKLDLSYNELKLLPSGMGYLVRLVDLNLSHNQFTELPPDIVNLRELKKLDVSHNKLKLLPALGELRRMELLYADHNDLQEMPDFYGCTALKELYMANNNIKEITEEFCDQMQQLNILNLRDNKLEVLPENVVLLKKLKRFDLTNNNLNKLPVNLGLLSQLQNLNMDGNKFTSLRQDVVRGGTDRLLRFLRDRATDTESDKDDHPRNNWPDKYAMRKAQALLLSGRALTSVPDELFDVAAETQVSSVDLANNKLSLVPLGITKVSESLTQVIISSNNLTTLPAELAACVRLQFLDLSKNQITDLPLEFGQLVSMREIIMSNNKLTKIPHCVYDMEHLEILLLANNSVTEIDVSCDALARLQRLAVLDLRNNSIMTVPPQLGNFKHLRSLELMGNLFRQPRHAVLEKGTDSLLCYLRDRIPTQHC